MQTTSQAFSALRGHVEQGVRVLMSSGAVWVIQSTMLGWQVVDAETGRPLSDANLNALGVECFIVCNS